MSINSRTDARTTISDYTLDEQWSYQDANELKHNQEGDWEMFQVAHTEDGDHLSWTPAASLSLTYSDSNIIKVSGCYSDYFPTMRRVKLDLGSSDGEVYRSVLSATESGGETIVTFEEAVGEEVTSNLESLELGIIRDPLALPHYPVTWWDYDSSNLLDSNGDYTGSEIYLDFSPSQYLLKAVGEGGLEYRLMELNALADLITQSGSDICIMNGFTNTVSDSYSISPSNLVFGALVYLSNLTGFDDGAPPVAYQCDGVDCNFSLSQALTGFNGWTISDASHDGSNIFCIFHKSGTTPKVSIFDGEDITTISDSFQLGLSIEHVPATKVGVVVDDNGDMVVYYTPNGESDVCYVVYDGISNTVKTSGTFSTGWVQVYNFIYDGFRLLRRQAGNVYVHEGVLDSTIYSSFSVSSGGNYGIAYKPNTGAYSFKQRLYPGVPVAEIDLKGDRVRLDVSGGAGQVCQNIELLMGR